MEKLTQNQQTQVVKLMPYVKRIVKSRGLSGPQEDDSLSACYEALCRAVLSYDPDQGMSLKNWVANYVRTALVNEQRFADGLSTESTQDARVRSWAHNNIPLAADLETQRQLLAIHFPQVSRSCIDRVVWGKPDISLERGQLRDEHTPRVPSSLSAVMTKDFLKKWLSSLPEYTKRRKPFRKIIQEYFFNRTPQKKIEREHGISRTTMHKYLIQARIAFAKLAAETRKGENE